MRNHLAVGPSQKHRPAAISFRKSDRNQVLNKMKGKGAEGVLPN